MSEEEKKAVEYIKNHIIVTTNKQGKIEIISDILVNLIERQQKELEYWKEHWQNAVTELNNCIPKSKMQEKIEELENEQDNLDNHHFIYSEYEMYRKIIFILEEFLEGEDEMNDCKVFIKLKDKTTGCISEEVPIDELIYNQNEIEFDFLDAIDEFGDIMDLSLPYNDFLFFQNDYEVIVKIKGEDE